MKSIKQIVFVAGILNLSSLSMAMQNGNIDHARAEMAKEPSFVAAESKRYALKSREPGDNFSEIFGEKKGTVISIRKNASLFNSKSLKLNLDLSAIGIPNFEINFKIPPLAVIDLKSQPSSYANETPTSLLSQLKTTKISRDVSGGKWRVQVTSDNYIIQDDSEQARVKQSVLRLFIELIKLDTNGEPLMKHERLSTIVFVRFDQLGEGRLIQGNYLESVHSFDTWIRYIAFGRSYFQFWNLLNADLVK